ncbi:MAG TPA: SCO family protein [Stellaceae bacterium]|nr:SCO family protein [Stellaceae bacterium]
MSRVTRRGLFAFIALLVLLLAGFAYETGWLGGGATDNAAALPIGGPFSLIDQNGVTRQDADFRGKLMLVYFGYTYCPDICPATLLAMSQAIDKLGPEGDQVQPIFITVDPERDTQAQMKLYAANFHPRLLALTGRAEQVDAAEKDYRVYAKKVTEASKADYLMDHSSFIYLMDRNGKLAALISPGVEPDAMAAAIRRHL